MTSKGQFFGSRRGLVSSLLACHHHTRVCWACQPWCEHRSTLAKVVARPASSLPAFFFFFPQLNYPAFSSSLKGCLGIIEWVLLLCWLIGPWVWENFPNMLISPSTHDKDVIKRRSKCDQFIMCVYLRDHVYIIVLLINLAISTNIEISFPFPVIDWE